MKANLSVPTGTYKGKDGTEKQSWSTIGKLMETKNGHSIKLEPLVANYLQGLLGRDFNGWINLYEEKAEGAAMSESSELPFS